MKFLSTKAFSLFHPLTLFLLIQTVFSYVFTGYQIRELDGTGTDFITDAASWTATRKIATNIYSTCSGTYLLGGYNVLGPTSGSAKNDYFSRSYSSLPVHTMIRYTMTVFNLDTWDIGNNDGFRFYFDGKIIDGWHLNSGTFPSDVCGAAYGDLINMRIFGMVQHSATTLTFRMISDFDEPPYNEAFGIRDFTLVFDQNPSTSESSCARAPVTVPSQCTCGEGYYSSGGCIACHSNCASCFGAGASNCYACKRSVAGWDGFQCVTCHAYCDDCFGTGNNQCTTCKAGYSYFAAGTTCLYDCPYPLTKTATGTTYTCATPCSTATDFIYWDKYCSSTCPAPLVQKTMLNGLIKLCTYPCSPGDYLYWDGTCQPDCGYPLQVTLTRGANLCTYKCNAGEFLDWTNVCVTSCIYPLVQKTIKGKNLCINPCNVPGEFLYWNQECSSSCVSPLSQRSATEIKYCDFPCSSPFDYLYWNGSCLSTCNFPLKVRVEMGKQFCDYPGDTANYLYWDGTNSSSCPSPPLIQRTEGTSPVLKFCEYGCKAWEYLYWNGTCALNCSFPLTKRIQNGKQFCDYPCTGTDILFWNGTCQSACSLPLKLRTTATKQYCDFPLSTTSDFLYWDGSSSSTCSAPLVQRIEGSSIIRKFCDFKCNPATEYLYYNGSCLTSCNPPHKIMNRNSRKFCEFACGTEFYYYNGSCLPSCPNPFIQQFDGVGKFCNYPCTNTNHFFYWNGSCLSSCQTPLQQQVIRDVKWCVYPCSANQFLSKDGLCLDSCDTPFITIKEAGLKYCVNPCLSSQYLLSNGTCIASCDFPMRVATAVTGNMCLSPCENPKDYYYEVNGACMSECNTTSITVKGLYLMCLLDRADTSTLLDVLLEAPLHSSYSIVTIPKLNSYMRYLDLNFPPKLERFVLSKGKSFLSLRLGQKMSSDMRSSFPSYPIPKVFQNQGLHSNFLVNFWEELTSWAIIIAVAIFFMIFELICRKKEWESGRIFYEKVLIIVKWNYLLILFSTSLDDIIVFLSLELRNLHSGSSFTGLSQEICLLLGGLVLILFIGVLLLVQKYRAVKRMGSSEKTTDFLVTWQGYQVIYRAFRDNNVINSLFYLLYLVRIVLCSLVASTLYVTPLFQTIFYMLISLVIIGYIGKMKPILNNLNYIQLLIQEIAVLVMNVCLVGLTILNSMGTATSSLGVMFGDIIIVCNTGINILFIVVLVIKLIRGIKDLLTVDVRRPQKKTHDWIQLLAIIPPQGGFGFEEIDVNSSVHIEEIDRLLAAAADANSISAKKKLLRNKANRIAPEPMDKSRASIQSRLSDNSGLQDISGDENNKGWQSKESRFDTNFDNPTTDERPIFMKEEPITTSRFGSESARLPQISRANRLETEVLMKLTKGNR